MTLRQHARARLMACTTSRHALQVTDGEVALTLDNFNSEWQKTMSRYFEKNGPKVGHALRCRLMRL